MATGQYSITSRAWDCTILLAPAKCQHDEIIIAGHKMALHWSFPACSVPFTLVIKFHNVISPFQDCLSQDMHFKKCDVDRLFVHYTGVGINTTLILRSAYRQWLEWFQLNLLKVRYFNSFSLPICSPNFLHKTLKFPPRGIPSLDWNHCFSSVQVVLASAAVSIVVERHIAGSHSDDCLYACTLWATRKGHIPLRYPGRRRDLRHGCRPAKVADL